MPVDLLSGVGLTMQQNLALMTPNTATVSRTGASIKVRIDIGNGTYPLNEIPGVGLPLWDISARVKPTDTKPHPPPILPGDLITVKGLGEYAVKTDRTPDSESRWVLAECIQCRYADGSWALPSNAKVTLQQKDSGAGPRLFPGDEGYDPDAIFPTIADVPVFITAMPTIPELASQFGMTQYEYVMTLDPKLTFPGAEPRGLEQGDTLLWSGLKTGQITLARVQRMYGTVDRTTCHFIDSET